MKLIKNVSLDKRNSLIFLQLSYCMGRGSKNAEKRIAKVSNLGKGSGKRKRLSFIGERMKKEVKTWA